MGYVLYTIAFRTGPAWAMLLPDDAPPPELAGLEARVEVESVPDESAGLRRLEEIAAEERQHGRTSRPAGVETSRPPAPGRLDAAPALSAS